MSAEEPSRAQLTLTMALWIAGFPVLWPLHAIRSWARGRMHAARAARVVPKERDAVLSRLERGEARAALESTLTFSTIASGPDEDVHVELTFEDGTAVLAASPELTKLLAAKSVPVKRVESAQLGLAGLFAWPLWLASVLVLASFATGELGYALLAAIVLLGLLGLARS